MLLVALTATTAGYALAYALPPTICHLITQALIFIALMFSPINYPASRMPGWLQRVHEVLPFQHMADVVRQTLDVPPGGIAVTPFAVLAVWCAAGLAITMRVMTRRA
jgi:ABC-2 type transport system permease protein